MHYFITIIPQFIGLNSVNGLLLLVVSFGSGICERLSWELGHEIAVECCQGHHLPEGKTEAGWHIFKVAHSCGRGLSSLSMETPSPENNPRDQANAFDAFYDLVMSHAVTTAVFYWWRWSRMFAWVTGVGDGSRLRHIPSESRTDTLWRNINVSCNENRWPGGYVGIAGFGIYVPPRGAEEKLETIPSEEGSHQ